VPTDALRGARIPELPTRARLGVGASSLHFRLGGDGCAEYNPRQEVRLMIYRIALRAPEEGYSVSVPGLPGCWLQGATEAEALEDIREAIREYLAVAAELTQGVEMREVDVAK
jgi:predicted RNase H-like HicB family nuclease